MKTDKRYRLRKLISYALRTKWTLLFGLIFTILAVLSDLLGPYLIGDILDNELVKNIGIRDVNSFTLKVSLFFVSVLLASGLRLAHFFCFQKSAHDVSLFMQEELFEHVQTLPISYFDRLPAGKVVSRITNDTKDVKVLFQVVLAQISTAFFYVVGVYVSLFLLDFKLALIALFPVPIILLLFRHFRINSAKYNAVYRENLSELNANLNESIQGMEIIRAFAKEDETYDNFQKVNQNIFDANIKLLNLECYSGWNAMSTLRFVTIGLVLLYFGLSFLSGRADTKVGLLYVFIDYVGKIFDNSQNIIQRLGQLEKANSAADHIFSLLKEKGNPESHEHNPLQGSIAFEDVSFYYKDEEWVLKDVSFTVPQGKTAAFVGHTGSGKSTIMNLLLRFYDVQKGRITADGKDIRELNVKGFRDHIAIVLQDPFLFKGDVYSNITLGDERITEEDALRAFLEVGGEEFLRNHPEGIHTPIQEKGNNFSSGERQLISFARALAKNPKILILDEATANIDSETERIIQKGTERLKKDRTTLLIAHRLSTIKDADQIYVLNKGKIIEHGTHQELIDKNGAYKEMYLDQSKSSRAEA
ncbi:ABC transporter ATP-binding protein [Guggenheimella bovis]